jgi:hypothetical protein
VTSWAVDGAAFEFAEMVGAEGDVATLVIVLGDPQADRLSEFFAGHVDTWRVA